MNILFVSAIYPYPLYSGGQVRIYNLLKKLSKNHTITLCSFIRDPKEQEYKSELNFCHRIEMVYRGHAFQAKYIFRTIFSSYPFLLSTYKNIQMTELIKKVIKEEAIDLIHIEPGYVYPSLPKNNLPVVASEHNIEHTIYNDVSQKYPFFFRFFSSYDVYKLKNWEKNIWKSVDSVTAVSPDDAEVITKLTNKNISVVLNGINEEYFQFKKRKKIGTTFQALFVGNFRWVQNKDAVKILLQTIWPQILAKFPTAKLEIVGKDFPSNLRSLLNSSIELNLSVSDIRDAFNRADILLAPIFIGGGTKYKILEAMASGVPVFTTDKGIEGLAVTDKKECIIVQNIDAWSDEIDIFIKNSSLFEQMTINARNFVVRDYTWDKIAHELELVWKKTYEKHS